MPEETVFSKIIRRELPADILYQDDLVTAFRDINPQAPTHILIIPNRLIPTAADCSAADEQALGRLFVVAANIAREQGIAEDGYRLVVNCGQHPAFCGLNLRQPMVVAPASTRSRSMCPNPRPAPCLALRRHYCCCAAAAGR